MSNEVVWTELKDVEPVELFSGVRKRTLWRSDSGAKALSLEIDAGCGWEGLDLHEPGPEEVYVVSGIFNDGVRDYPAGTFIHNDAGTSHVPQSKTGCTLFVFYPEG